ncbi:hypothetical protein LVD15_00860 [Fulvivirga maritima]|uniref:hypothetical protein n=1 Tax=Fulvivirga maritima TaxID=2904247 RepID=UPI001F4677DE|nr:hypothetical protein [Fulvivirga maritima]UII27019.1 hypothetical protein LVD15_00860 [Fulvivirga maritima]
MTDFQLIEGVLSQLIVFVHHLHWSYIFTHMLLAYASIDLEKSHSLVNRYYHYLRMEWWPLLFGIIYSLLYIFKYNFDFEHTFWQLQSFLFALVFEAFIIEKMVILLKKPPRKK